MIGETVRHFKVNAVLQLGRNAELNGLFPSAELFVVGASPEGRASFDLWIGPPTSARLGEAPTLTCAPRLHNRLTQRCLVARGDMHHDTSSRQAHVPAFRVSAVRQRDHPTVRHWLACEVMQTP
jgi:hypothetical protein